jgi:hypothetical protein
VGRIVLRWGLRLGLLAAIGVAGWVLGLHVGKVPGSGKPAGSAAAKTKSAAPSTAPSSTAPQSLDLTGAVTAFDPDGDGQEDPASVGNATDGDPSTGWQTELYYTGGTFTGKKTGVGLLVDLGSPKAIREVDLALSGQGNTTVELRAAPGATSAPTAIAGFPQVLATATEASEATLKPKQPVTSRYWLVWLTELPRSTSGGGWQGEIDEMSFLPA